MGVNTKSMIKLRKYQEQDVQAIESTWEDYNSIIYQLPTGGGKSVVLSSIVERYKDEKILILAHKRRLLTQLRDHLSNVGIKAGLLIANINDDMDSNVIVASIMTVVNDKRLEKLLERDWDRVIIDEARNSRTNSYDKVLELIETHNPGLKKLGVDATPYRKDKKRLDKHFDAMVCSVETTASLIEKGFLAEYKTYVAPIGKIEEEVMEVSNDYQQQQLSSYMRQDAYLNYVVDMYKQYGKDRQAIVFAVDKSHAKSLKKAFLQNGIKEVEEMNSSMTVSEIEEITESYEKKRTQILINIEMLTEGVDLPDTGCIIGARPTKSLTLYLQMVGRGTRLKSDGSELIVLDCCGWTESFGQLSSPKHWSLNPEIDPNNPRLNNRVVGRKLDGTYEEDLSDFIGEIVELSPEEYLRSVQNGLERAKSINEGIDQRVIKVFKDMHEILSNKLKKRLDGYKKDISIKDEHYRLIFSDEDNKESHDGWRKILVVIHFGHFQGERLHSEMDNKGSSSLDEYMKMSKLNGVINELFLENPHIEMQLLELFEQVKELDNSKIHLEGFKEATKVFKQEQFELEVEKHVVEGNGIFTLEKGLRKDNWFKGYSNDSIIALEITGGKINSYSNTIIVTFASFYRRGETYTEEKRHIKGERIYDMLKQGEWNSPN